MRTSIADKTQITLIALFLAAGPSLLAAPAATVPAGLSVAEWSSIRQQAYIKASNTDADDQLFSVAISGDTVVVGAFFEDSAATGVNGDQSDDGALNSGAAYVFVRNGNTWTQQAYLKASNTDPGDRFGEFLAMSGDTIVVGAPFEDSNATGVNGHENNDNAMNSGAAYVFVRDGTNWTQQAYLKASNAEAGDEFGEPSISGDTIVIGAQLEASDSTGINGDQTNNRRRGSGAAYVFVRNGTTWTQQAYLKASNAGGPLPNETNGDRFGVSVVVDGDTLVVGAHQEDSSATGINGDQDDNSATNSGAAYVFVRNGNTWTQEAYLKASNPGVQDLFGFYLGLSGDTLVVGAVTEDSNATGVNGDQTNNDSMDSGAAYAFVRNGATWSQQAYLKASNTGANDRFGRSVALSGNTVVVGAARESSNATGVNGDQNNNNASESGAAYVFVRKGTNWFQQAYLKASNTGANDTFGMEAAISSDTVVISAVFEDSAATGVNGDETSESAANSGAAYIFTGVGPRPRITLGPEAFGGCFIRFSGIPGWSYELQRATSIDASWSTIDTLTAPPSGSVEFLDSAPPGGQAFYRVISP